MSKEHQREGELSSKRDHQGSRGRAQETGKGVLQNISWREREREREIQPFDHRNGISSNEMLWGTSSDYQRQCTATESNVLK